MKIGLLIMLALAAHAAPAPNVLIILADDLGYSDLGCYGGEIRTPHLDALASEGVRFTQFYTSTRCCPTRASLLTGLYPHQAGIGLMTLEGKGIKDKPSGYRGQLNAQCVTFAQVLKAHGYATAAAGKWHVGGSESPTKRGFEQFYGFTTGYAVDSWDATAMQSMPARNEPPAKDFFATDAITDHALDMVHDMRGQRKPWLLYLAYQAPHFPLASRAEDMTGYPELYARGWDVIREQRHARMKALGLIPKDTALPPRARIPHQKQAEMHGSMTSDGMNPAWESLPAARRADLAMRMAVYAGMVTGMDRNIGRVVADLRAAGEVERTLILFLSDNGACAEWDPFGFESPQPFVSGNTEKQPNVLHTGAALAAMHRESLPSYGSGWANASNTPFRLYKHYAHEGGIGTACIARFGAAQGGRFEPTPLHVMDVMPTLLDLCGGVYPSDKTLLEGRSFLPLIKQANESPAPRFLAWEHEHHAAARERDWKIVRLDDASPWELYDLSKDRNELHDLATEQPDRVTALAVKWQAWAERTQVLPRP